MNQNPYKFNFDEFGIPDNKGGPTVVKKAHYIDETSSKKNHIIAGDLINFGIINEDIKQ